MKIYVVTSSYPRHRHDHAGSFVEAQVRHLVALGHDVEVFCWADKLRPTLESEWPVHRVSYAPADAQYLFYGGGTPENLTRYPGLGLLVVPAVVAMVATVMRRPAPDVVIGHWFVPGGAIARLAGSVWNVPSLVVGHSGGLQMLSRLPGAVASRAVGAIASGPTTLPSRPLADLARSLAPSASPRVMPMGIDLPGSLAEPPPNEKRGERALFLGRLEPIKGPAVALEAAQEAGWALEIAGEGSLRSELEEGARVEAGVRQSASFLGFIGGDEKWSAIDRAAVSLHPSVPQSGRHEGLPVSVLECALRQTFPIVSGAPGIEEWLVDVDRQLCAPGDVGAFADRLRWWAELEPRMKRGLAEAQRVRVEPLRWERWIREWDTLLRQF